MIPEAQVPLENAVVVAVKAEKEISKSALQWALTHVVRPGDFVTLLAVVPSPTKGWRWRLWSFPKFTGDFSGSSNRRKNSSNDHKRCEVSASCSQMAIQFQGPDDQNEVNMKIKVLMSPDGSPASDGAVAAESKRVGANWIVLDKQLKHEARRCLEELHCNIVLMKHNHANVLRLNLSILHPKQPVLNPQALTTNTNLPISPPESSKEHHHLRHSTPISSPGQQHDQQDQVGEVDSVIRECCASLSGFTNEQNSDSLFEKFHKAKLIPTEDSGGGRGDERSMSPFHANVSRCKQRKNKDYQDIQFDHHDTKSTLQEKFHESDQHPPTWVPEEHGKEVRDIPPVSRVSPSIPPPLCSVCQHKTPVFGKPPRNFSYKELEDATDMFSEENFLAEGGYGWVHRGVLGDGQVVAIKRLKMVGGLKGDRDFRAEVDVLSRAQHRNVVLLIGFCTEGTARYLVFEYICNGSLDSHLYGRNSLDWNARAGIAVGVARGLRYLHEDCRVGFVHMDVRPSNILLTHDFEPLVADFGLARWLSKGTAGADTHVVGTFGYLAPEYIEAGSVTEKADVYAFGVVLLELLTGRRAMDLSRPKGQQFLVEWARPLIRPMDEGGWTVPMDTYLDPHLDDEDIRFFAHQFNATVHAASLCLRRDPLSRPSMSKVLRILEGDETRDISLRNSRSPAARIEHTSPHNTAPKGSHSMRFSNRTGSNAVQTDRNQAHVF